MKTYKDFLEESYDLSWVDNNDTLDGYAKELEECIHKGALYPLYENNYLSEWENDAEHWSMDWYKKKIKEEMESEGMGEEYEAHENDIAEWMMEHNEKSSIYEALKNTGEMTMFYTLNESVCVEDEEMEEMQTERIIHLLGVKEGNRRNVKSLLENAMYDGDLRIYFNARPIDIIEAEGKSIRFHGTVHVGIINTFVGGGDVEEIELDVTLPFERENIYLDKKEKWGWMEISGEYDGWAEGTEYEILDEESTTNIEVNEEQKRKTEWEEKCERRFREGKCTFGDMDMRRHRDVVYINEYPCGNKCTHCGTFWID